MGDGADMARHIEEITYYATIEAEAERYAHEVLGHEPTPDELTELLDAARHAHPGDMPDALRLVVAAQRADRSNELTDAEQAAIAAGCFWMLVLVPDGRRYPRDRRGRPRLPAISAPRSIFLDLDDARRAAAALTEKTGRPCLVLAGEGVPRG